MNDQNRFSENFLDVVGEMNSRAKQRAKSLQLQSEQASRCQKAWDDLNSYIHRGWSFHIIDLIGRDIALFQSTDVANKEIGQVLSEISNVANQQAMEVRRRFPAYLEEACMASGLPLDQASRHPRYTFEDGFFKLEVDDHKNMARLSDYEGVLSEFPSDVGAAVEVIQREHGRVFRRPFDGEKFLFKVRKNYLAITTKDHLPDGSGIPIRNITRRLGKNEDKFRTDEFLIDLSRLVERGPTEIDGVQLDLQQTKDTNQGMLLHGIAGRGGYIGFIVFRRLANG